MNEKKILYFDCISGISGDMTIGALLDLGIDKNFLIKELKKLDITGYDISIKKGQKNSITGTDFKVILENNHRHTHHHNHNSSNHTHSHHNQEHNHNNHSNSKENNHDQNKSDSANHVHRNLNNIKNLINKSKLNNNVKNLSKSIFKKIAMSEAKIHDKPISEVHFHEVGAIDSIIDIVGTAICIDYLNVDKIYFSPLHVGTGFVNSAHGKIPVPAPATLDILKNVPVFSTGIRSELVTPTGAAIAKTLADDFIYNKNFKISKIGYGIGDKDLDITNMLRVYTAKKKSSNNELILLETNIDDMNPEIYSYLIPKLVKNKALDVYTTNIMMKKNRPAIKLSILTKNNNQKKIENILFAETTTLGIRKTKLTRKILKRKKIKFESSYGTVTLKIAYKNDKILKFSPEYEECKKIAHNTDTPLQKIYKNIIREGKDFLKNNN